MTVLKNPTDCCNCNRANPISAQPDVVVSGSTCDCQGGGSHNGSYSQASGGGGRWRGTSGCDVDELLQEVFEEVDILLTCLGDGLWKVRVTTYQLHQDPCLGSITGRDLVFVTDEGKFEGEVTVPLDCNSGNDCEFTITWSP